MSRHKGSSVVDFLFGVCLGALAGAVVGILWAPRSGIESRHRLSEGLKDARDKTEKYMEGTRQSTEGLLSQLKDTVETKYNLLLEAITAGKQAAVRTHDEIQTQQSEGNGSSLNPDSARE